MMTSDRRLDGLTVEAELFLLDPQGRDRSPESARLSTAVIECTSSGLGVLRLAGGATVVFTGDDVTVQPPTPALPSSVTRPHTLDTRPRTAVAADGGDSHVFAASGRVRASFPDGIGVFDELREPLVLAITSRDRIHQLFDDVVEEVRAQRAGCRAMAVALLRQCLILLLRAGYERGEGMPGLALLMDSRLARPVAAMREHPERPFTVAVLAELAGMSRSVFCAHFTCALGRPPMEFLIDTRLERAARLLTTTDLPVKAIAARVGYSSRSSFTRAFAAVHGLTPRAIRDAGATVGRGRRPGPGVVTPRGHAPLSAA